MVDSIEVLILSALFHNEEYTRKVLPFIKPEYFENRVDRVIFQSCYDFITEYNALPTKEAIVIHLNNENLEISADEYQEATELIGSLKPDEKINSEWMLKSTEEFCKDRALHNALLESVKIASNNSKKLSKGQIPDLMKEALSVSFDPHIGHDYLNDHDSRFDFYHTEEKKIPFDLKFMNNITGGGLPLKTLNIILAGTAVGKSLAMCHFAAANLVAGHNVLYITLEMSEERIAERIDANLLNLPISNLSEVGKAVYDKKIENLKNKTNGKLIVKEYPTAVASVIHFRHLLNELALKRDFIPEIIYVDYLNISASSRLKPGRASSYEYVKAISEELRGLAVEYNVPVVTATQTNRSGFSSSDLDVTDTSESFGIPMTADFMFALISNEKLEQMNKIKVQQIKNRYNDVNRNKRFLIGIDRPKMRLYDLEDSAQEGLTDSGQDPQDPLSSSKRENKGAFDDIEI